MQTLGEILENGQQINYKAIAEKMRALSLDDISPGDQIALPSWYHLKDRQRYINIVLQICNEHGREYIYMAAMLLNGRASQDSRTYVYWPLRRVSSLRPARRPGTI